MDTLYEYQIQGGSIISYKHKNMETQGDLGVSRDFLGKHMQQLGA